MKSIQTKYYKYLIIITFIIALIILLSAIIFIKQKNKSVPNAKLTHILPEIKPDTKTNIIEHYLGLNPNLENLKTEFRKINPDWNQEVFAYNYHMLSKSNANQKITDAIQHKIFAIFLNFNDEKMKSYQTQNNLLDALNQNQNNKMHIFWKKEKPNTELILVLKDQLLHNTNKWQQTATNILDKIQTYINNDIDQILKNQLSLLEKNKIIIDMNAGKLKITDIKDFIKQNLMANANAKLESNPEQNILIKQLRKQSFNLMELRNKFQTLQKIIQKIAQNGNITTIFQKDMKELENLIKTTILEIINESDKLNI
ncbi:hypothetical protein [Mulberry dwarf phytoplasma]|uniref:hypothetical protein n=1 Tax=Mulberry dwarf phytoplasma TaxID=186171 RepID=UPI001D104D34|nr:hypothetical protein [Mulberry dwarf phytoplasma]